MYPFDRPTNYGEMLNKIGISTFLLALGLTWVVSHFSPAVSSLLRSEKTEVEILTVHIPLLYAVPAVLLGVIFRIVRVHNKLSDLFGIRSRFDLEQILIPLCAAVGVPVDKTFRERLQANRELAMERTFYAYASFEEPKISKALVLASIDRWTWYWVLLEFMALLLIAGVVLLSLRSFEGACFVFGGLFLSTPLFLTYTDSCGRLAKIQIEEITSDASRSNAIRTELADLKSL
jgi:hypothetical protein